MPPTCNSTANMIKTEMMPFYVRTKLHCTQPQTAEPACLLLALLNVRVDTD